MADVKRIYALQHYYTVVYLDGLGEPVESLIGSAEPLDIDSRQVLDHVCRFIQQSIDLDCRKVLFMMNNEAPDV